MRGVGGLFGLALLLIAPGWAAWRASVSLGINPFLVLLWAALISLVASLAHWIDKRRAEQGGRRIPESFLHGCELAGGWPGALVARRLLRHKTSKWSYRLVFWGIVVLHQLLAVGFLALSARGLGG